jgi:hypothetical protein
LAVPILSCLGPSSLPHTVQVGLSPWCHPLCYASNYGVRSHGTIEHFYEHEIHEHDTIITARSSQKTVDLLDSRTGISNFININLPDRSRRLRPQQGRFHEPFRLRHRVTGTLQIAVAPTAPTAEATDRCRRCDADSYSFQ